MKIASLAILGCLSGVVHAGDSHEEPKVVVAAGHRSENVATALTVAGIVVPVALVANMFRPGVEAGDGQFMIGTLALFGLQLGPSIGNWYARDFGGPGLGVRFAGYVSFLVGLQYFDDAKRCARGEPVEDGCDGSERTAGKISFALGAWMVAGSWAYDLITSRRSVRLQNRRLRGQLTPIVSSSTAGLAFGGTF